MRIASTLLFLLLAGPVLAGECDRWTAGMEEDEGGPSMMASVCAQASASAPEAQHALLVQCGATGNFWIRYLPYAEEDYLPSGNDEFKTDMKFSLDEEKFTLPARYEEMDGAMAMETPIDSPLMNTLMHRKQVVVSDVNGKVPSATFTLAGADKALKELIKTCAK